MPDPRAKLRCIIPYSPHPCPVLGGVGRHIDRRISGTYPGWSGEQDRDICVRQDSCIRQDIYVHKILVGQKRGGKRLLCLTVVTLLVS